MSKDDQYGGVIIAVCAPTLSSALGAKLGAILRLTNPIEEQDPVQVVQFVEQNAGFEAVGRTLATRGFNWRALRRRSMHIRAGSSKLVGWGSAQVPGSWRVARRSSFWTIRGPRGETLVTAASLVKAQCVHMSL